eukprot:TRINITY_DN7705_c0_g1_i1.p1 TRINITY_DN7705_c0_g1~~TRINITY_DN7705_c0_g1_i1.p1  ORF type:complete len:856 (+),score=183.73 TRINITY_DN7705_c0_g1_i1:75-2642(+)
MAEVPNLQWTQSPDRGFFTLSAIDSTDGSETARRLAFSSSSFLRGSDSSHQVDLGHLEPHLEPVLSQIIPSTDPLDAPNFNPIDYINGLFPNEHSLADIEIAISKMKSSIAATDAEILKSVRTQVTTGYKGRQDLEDAQENIRQLFSKVSEIKSKAEQSDRMVTEICREIKSLDFAKRNLTTTITAIRRMQMLTSAVDQLKLMASKKQFREAGNLLEAVDQLAEHFTDFKRVYKIEEVSKTVSDIKADLQKQIYAEFEGLFESQTAPSSYLADALLVIDSLGKVAKDDFLIWFCNKQLTEYNQIFQRGESARTENIERRFSWLKKVLRIYDEQYNKIFPPHWKVAEMLCEEFCFITRQSIVDNLEETKRSLDVEVLISALKKTIAFEKELVDRFGVEIVDKSYPIPIENTLSEEDQTDLNNSGVHNEENLAVEAVKSKWRQFQKDKIKAERKRLAQANMPKREVSKFKGIISSAFDMYMDLYISKEDQSMKATVQKLVSEETWIVDDDEQNKVLNSSTDLIIYFRTCMKACSSLTKNKAFFDTYGLFKKYMREYANALVARLPSSDAKLSDKDEKTLSLIVNTAQYLGENLLGMRDAIKERINERYKDQIDFASEQNEMDTVIHKSLKAIVQGLATKVEPALVQMSKMPWGSWESVNDQSDYVNQLSIYLQQSVPIYCNWLVDPGHFRFVLDSFCKESFIPLLISYVYKCRRMSEVGAQQLMLDFTAIKSILLDLPNMGKMQASTPSRQYIKIIQKGMSRAELILKLIGATPQNTLVDTYKAMIANGSESDFQKILDLRGVNRTDQKQLMDTYNQNTDRVAPSGKSIKNLLKDVLPSKADLSERFSVLKASAGNK